MKLIIFLVTILLSSNYLECESNKTFINVKVQLSDNTDRDIRVFAVYYGNSPEGNILINEATSDKFGAFSLEFPDYILNSNIIISSPHYKTSTLEYIKGDKTPSIESVLTRNLLIDKLDSAKIVISKNDIIVPISIPIESNKYENKFDINSSELKGLKLKIGDTVQYYFLLNNEKFTPLDTKETLEFTKDDIYKPSMIISSQSIHFEVDFAKYQSKEKVQKESSSEWVNSPVNQQYSEIIKLLPKNTITQLYPNYEFLVRQTYPNIIKDLSKEKLDSMKEKVINDYNNYLRITDSLLMEIKDSHLKDYLSYLRLEILAGPGTEYTIKNITSVIDSSNEIPSKFDGVISSFIRSRSFIENSEKRIDYLEKIISKTKDPTIRNQHRYNLYYSIAKTALMDSNAYLAKTINVLDSLYKSDYTFVWTKGVIEKTIQSLKLKMSKDAPDFSFKSLDGKNHKLSDFKGKWVILDFWGTWCVPCRTDTPYLLEAYKEISKDSFEIISISSDKSMTSLTDYIDKHKITWISTVELEDYAEGIIEKYGVTSFPTLFLIDPKGQFIDIESSDLRGEVLIPNLREEMAKE